MRNRNLPQAKERKKERKENPTSSSVVNNLQLAPYFRLEAIFNLSISDLSKQCRLGISQIEHLQM
jgi:hypothetical protein